MLFTQIARVTVQPVVQRQQRRTILNWMTNYPNRVSEFRPARTSKDNQGYR